MGKTVRRLLAWVLAIAMVLTGAGIPSLTKTAQAADKTVTNGMSSSNPVYVEFVHDTANSTGSYNQYSVQLHNNTSGAICDWTITVKFASDPGFNAGWNGVSYSAATKTMTIQTYAEATWSNAIIYAGDSGSGAGFQIKAGALNSATVTITYKEGNDSSGAQTGSGSSGGSGGTSSGETLEGVTATVSKISGNTDWAEYNYTLKNQTSSALAGVTIKIPANGTVNNLQSWNCSVDYKDGYIIISHTQELAAGATYSCSSDTKFGFAGGASLGKPEVYEYDASSSASGLNYELTGQTKNVAFKDTPVGKHGKLSLQTVSGYKTPIIVDEHGNPFQLRGASTHGVQWFPEYVNKGAFQSLRDEWGVNMIRLACYITQYNGYTVGGQSLIDQKIQEGVQAAKDLGMYIIIDWHVHEENPHTAKDSWAKPFFEKYAKMYKDYDNVIFEICNEPTGVQWYNGSGGDLYTYCKEIATVIRNQGSDALIVCGTNTWSQDVDDVAAKPLKNDGFSNILYTFHFYSGSHYNDKMQKVRTAINAGTPIFVTEFGICDASGNGGFDTANADAWIKLCDENNISYACWSFCNKGESASYLKTSCNKTTGGFTGADLSTTGIWLVNTYRAHEEAEQGGSTTTQTVSSITLNKSKLELTTNGSTTSGSLTPTITTSDGAAYTGNVTWTSSNTSVVSVANGVVTAKGNGTATVTAKAGGKSATCTVTVTTVLKGISLSSKTISMNKGTTKKLTVTYNPTTASNKKVTWSSNAESVASVSDGTITAKGNGTAVITARSEEGGYTATCTVTVTTAVTGVTLNKSALRLEVGTEETLTASVVPNDADNKNVTWKSDNTSVATVNTAGKVTALKKGTANITVTTQDGSKTATCRVTVNKKTRTVPQDAKCNLTSRTANSLTINISGSLDGTAQREYQIGNSAWTTNTTFTGLESCKSYTVKVRYKETDEYEASNVFATATFYTLSNTPYTIDISKVSDSNYCNALCEVVNGSEIKTVTYDAGNKILTLTQAGKIYTLTGTNPDLTIVVADGINQVVLQDASMESLDVTRVAGSSITVTNKGTNSIISKKDNVPGIQTQSNTELIIAGDGRLTVTGGAGAAGIGNGGTVKITGGTVTINGGAQAPAIKAEQVELLGGTVNVNVGSGADDSVSAVTVEDTGKIVIDNAQVSSNTSNIYSKDPVGPNGNSITMQKITYKDENGVTIETLNARRGSNITLLNIAAQKGYTKAWSCDGVAYQAGAVVSNVNKDMTFTIVATAIMVTAITVKNGNVALTEKDVITLDKRLNQTASLQVSVTPLDALDTSVLWLSGDTKVVTVSNGKLTPVGVGEAVITVMANDGSGTKATVNVKVIESEEPKKEDKKDTSTGQDTDKKTVGNDDKQGTTGDGDGDEFEMDDEEDELAKAVIKKVAAGKKKLTVKWKKVEGADGYQICVSKKKNFAKGKNFTVKSGSKTKAVIKKLSSKKKYYVRIRAYSKTDEGTVYGEWSKAKNKKVK